MDAPSFFPPSIDEKALESLFERGEEIGLRLELTDGGITWGAAPGQRHQEIVFDVMTSIKPPTQADRPFDYHRVYDLNVMLPDSRAKRPDVSIWCRRPPEDEGFVHGVPEAVVEITSPGYEKKDLIEGPPIYLRNGVKDVLVLDRRSGEVHHWDRRGYRVHLSPRELALECGCLVTI